MGQEFSAALGAARLGQIAASNVLPAEVITAPNISHEIEPETPLTSAFDDAYALFKEAYGSLKAIQ